MRKQILFLFSFLLGLSLFAQQSEEVLLTIDGNPVYADEFSRVFSKNLSLIENEEDRDVNEYLDLFINYKLKVLEAEDLKLDTLASFNKEYNLYKKQLARKYINQSEVSEQLLQEAYVRLQNEVNASHILFNLRADASPKDTLEVYKKAISVREKILKSKETFASLAKQYSEDPSAKINGGNLGWFGVFSMVYPFETGAYQTEIGAVSMPVRTKFGYHLIKVNDKRINEGEVTVAHIMIEETKDPEADKAKAEKLYKELQEGANFADLAKQYSDDKNTAIHGGKLSSFKKGKLNSEKFENVAFNLNEIAGFSKPIKTKYGWHIIQLLAKDTVGSFDEEKFTLERNIKKDSRAQLIASEVLENIKKLYQLKEDDPNLSYFNKNIKVNVSTNTLESSSLTDIPQKNLITLGEEGETYKDFAEYITANQKKASSLKTTPQALAVLYEEFKNDFLKEYHSNHLENIDEDYAHVIEEYRNGLLLFDLMEKKIWNAAKKDTTALQQYYNKHKNEFVTPASFKGIIASSSSKKMMKKLKRELKKESFEKVKENFKDIIFNSNTFELNDPSLPKKLKIKKGISGPYQHNGTFVVIKINAIEKPKIIPFENAQGQVISAYQKQLEESWLASLRAKHNVKVNQSSLAKLKKKFE
ncbi:peptidylprolyl isomerase [Mesonia aestuariivivens]|uniref:peptidylprolyl isomerase n=1 Tax=Mesonia aestuariivivens TaxID=2796128 RepID=A0ABS6W1I1_9FLAO|nr:peptidylprolyl isomerase [Mesonia aestuariivivens]MBW2961715.1 peptidylprolyl isomerase [Mesonia aestuariivivens]